MTRRWFAALVLTASLPGSAVAAPGAWVLTARAPDEEAGEVSVFADGSAFVHAWSGEFYTSRDFGLTWTVTDRRDLVEITMGSPKLGYAATGGGLRRTTDGGRTWRAVALPSPGDGRHDTFMLGIGTALGGRFAAAASVPYRMLAPGCSAAPERVELVLTTNGGKAWRRRPLPGVGHPVQVSFATAQDGLVAVVDNMNSLVPCDWSLGGNSATIYVTHDGGRSFRRVLSCDICWNAIMLGPDEIVAVENGGRVHHSTDGGSTFRVASTVVGLPEFPLAVWALAAAGDGSLAALLNNGGTAWAPGPAGPWVLERVPSTAVKPGGAGDIALAGDRGVLLDAGGIHARVGAGVGNGNDEASPAATPAPMLLTVVGDRIELRSGTAVRAVATLP